MKKTLIRFSFLALIAMSSTQLIAQESNASEEYLPFTPGEDGWEMTWNDEFEGTDADLDAKWDSANGPTGGMVLCSRWRENAVLNDGILELQIKKESRGGQDWTSASVWTKQQFQYGYYECRYKYAGGSGTNNSFWTMTRNEPQGMDKFELDINEGHYKTLVNTNIHNWSAKHVDGRHDTWAYNYYKGRGDEAKPAYSYEFKKPLKAQKIRLTSDHHSQLFIDEFRIFAPKKSGYPEAMMYSSVLEKGYTNHATDPKTKITASGEYTYNANGDKINEDGLSSLLTNINDGRDTGWISQGSGDKWVEFEFDGTKSIGCIQFINGYQNPNKTEWKNMVTKYKIEYFDGKEWIEAVDFDHEGDADFSEEFHTYGMLWTDTFIQYYFDGELLRTHYHDNIHTPTHIFLSLALLGWNFAGEITDDLDGESMKVDYVRYYQQKK